MIRNKEGEVEGMNVVEETSTIEDKARGPKVSLTPRSKRVTQVAEEAMVEVSPTSVIPSTSPSLLLLTLPLQLLFNFKSKLKTFPQCIWGQEANLLLYVHP